MCEKVVPEAEPVRWGVLMYRTTSMTATTKTNAARAP